MSSRSAGGPVTFLLDIGAKVPWQASVIAAVAFFVTLHFTTNTVAPVSATATMGPFALADVLTLIATFLQYIVPALLLTGALASAVIRKRARVQQSAPLDSDGGEAIRNLTWWQFEKFLSAHFAQLGFTMQKTGRPTADGGVNLKLRRGTDKYFVQCKQWRARRIDAATVRNLYRVMETAGAAGGIVLTAGSFSDETRKFVEGRKIELIDGHMLEALMRPDHPRPVAAKSAVAPECPNCGSPMQVRVARKGAKAGKAFWGCPRFPACRAILPA
jgi:restriction system protein